MEFKVKGVLATKQRISSVDFFRGLAILAVVIFHYGTFLPLGYIGVDLFFVISGLLVGGILTREFIQSGKVDYGKFILRRGMKIWPSYYTFLVLGSLLAYFMYSDSHPEYLVPLADSARYLLFFQNYTGLPLHLTFDHVWSLCVEEHFYIILPILFLFLQFFIRPKNQLRWLTVFVCATIILGVVMKVLSFYMTTSKDTYSATHNRVDALAWGVLLHLIVTTHGEGFRKHKGTYLFFVAGFGLFVASLYFKVVMNDLHFNKFVFHSVLPASFFLMILGVYYVDFSRFKLLRIAAYFSYNWYLWHVLFAPFLCEKFGDNLTGLLAYMVLTFGASILVTILVEEPALARRDSLVAKVFGSNSAGNP